MDGLVEGDATVEELRQKMEAELRNNILPFWLKHAVDEEFGGFRGRIKHDLTVDARAPKGLILNTQILWTFSRAFRFYREPAYLSAAQRAYEYLACTFWDRKLGGVYWLVDHQGIPMDSRKRIDGHAFAAYALAEYSHASGDREALGKAMRLVERMEVVGHDAKHGGYFESFERDWKPALKQRPSGADLEERKSANTHLALLQAYTALLRPNENPLIRLRLRELVEIVLDRMIDPAAQHVTLSFDPEWRTRSEKISFGHGIQASWMLCQAAETLADGPLLERVREAALLLAQAVFEQGIDDDGGVLHFCGPGANIDSDKHWWVQAEAVAGFVNAWQISGWDHYLIAAERIWEFVEQHMVDREHGEWLWIASEPGAARAERDKAGPGKGPLPNSRACFEVMERLDAIWRGSIVVQTLPAKSLPGQRAR